MTSFKKAKVSSKMCVVSAKYSSLTTLMIKLTPYTLPYRLTDVPKLAPYNSESFKATSRCVGKCRLVVSNKSANKVRAVISFCFLILVVNEIKIWLVLYFSVGFRVKFTPSIISNYYQFSSYICQNYKIGR